MSRSVLIDADNFVLVPALPDDVLRSVYGTRSVDAGVERCVLTFIYWDDAAASRFILVEHTMMMMRRDGITADNVQDLLRLLDAVGRLQHFADLCVYQFDRRMVFRRYLATLGVLPGELSHRQSWAGIDVKGFVDGFAVGVASSFATVVVDLGRFLLAVARAQWDLEVAIVTAPAHPLEASRALNQQVLAALRATEALLLKLDPFSWPAALQEQVHNLQAEIDRHLDEGDFFGAGRALGRTAGDLWMLLSCASDLAALAKLAGHEALRLASLAFSSVRAGLRAAEMARLADLLRIVGANTLATLPRVGAGYMTTLFPPRLVESLWTAGLALVDGERWASLAVPQFAFEAAGGGSGFDAAYMTMVSGDRKPLLMTAVSDYGSGGGAGSATKRLAGPPPGYFDDIDVWLETERPPGTALRPEEVPSAPEVQAAIDAMMAQRLVPQLERTVQEIAQAQFDQMRRAGTRLSAAQFGERVHAAMRPPLAQWAQAGKAGRQVLSEISMGNLDKLLSRRPRSGWRAAANRKLMDTTVVDYLARRRDLLRAMEGDAAAGWGKPEIVALARRRWNYSAETTLGSLRADAVFVDEAFWRIDIVDWTSDGNFDRMQQLFDRMAADIAKATGDASKVPTAPRKLMETWKKLVGDAGGATGGKDLAEIEAAMRDLVRHATRETVLREAILADMTGAAWFVKCREVFYTNLGDLWRAVPPRGKSG